MRKITGIILSILICGMVSAQTFNEKLEKGHTALRGGDTNTALEAYRDLQVDDPESELLYYNIGRAHYKEGEAEAELESPEGAVEAFNLAKASFEKVLTSSDEEIRTSAGFNYANCIAQMAKQSVSLGDHEKTIAAFEESVGSYEEFLRRHPDHEGAKNNLDHMRYYLKNLMQNPPPPQDQQQQQQQDQEKNKEDQKDQEQEKKEEEKQDGENEGEQEPQQGEQQQQQMEQQEGNGEEEPEEQDRQNIEAILQSLEDIDNQEQKKTRNQRRDVGMRRNWW